SAAKAGQAMSIAQPAASTRETSLADPLLLRCRTGSRSARHQRAQKIDHRHTGTGAAATSAASAADAAADALGDIERRASLFVFHVELRAVLREVAYNLLCAPLHGRVDRRRAVRIERVDVDAALEAQLHGFN